MADPGPGGFGKYLAIVSAVVGLMITLNTAVTGYFKERSDEYDRFRSEVDGEEGVWKSLYSDYLTVFSADYASNPMGRQNKVVALYTLAQRDVPTFDEFREVSPEAKRRATCRLIQLQAALLNSLDQEGKRENIEAILQSRRGQPAQAATCAEPVAVSAPVTVYVGGASNSQLQNASSTISETQSAPATVLLSPTSATGWDIDIFWCDGRNAQANFKQAEAFGQLASASANSGRAIAPGVSLGRVRVRSIARAKVNGPSSSQFIAVDPGAGETEAGGALQGLFNAKGANFSLAEQTNSRTPWYLSAVVCS